MDANQALQYGDPATAAMNGAYSDYQGAVNKEQQQMKPAMDKLNQTAANPVPAPPEQQKVSAAPQQEAYQKDSQAWITAFAALSAFAGAQGRARGTGALKAFAAGTKGLQAGNQQAFDNAYKTWEGDTKATLDNNKMIADKYKAILDNRALTEQEAIEQMKMVAYENQDAIGMKANRYDQFAANWEAMNKTRYNAELATQKLQQKAQLQQEQLDAAAKFDFSSAAPTDTVPGTGLTVKAIEQYGDAIAKGAKPSAIGLGYGMNPVKKAVDNYVGTKYPEFDMAKSELGYQGQQTAEKVGAKNFENMTIAVNNIDNSLPLLAEQVKAINPSRFKSWNEFQNYLNENTGDPKVVALKQAVEDTTSDFQQVLARGGQVTDTVRASAHSLLDAAWSQGQFDAASNMMRRTGANQLASARKSLQAVDEVANPGESNTPASTAGNIAPEGTVINDANGKAKVKRGGKWVDQ